MRLGIATLLTGAAFLMIGCSAPTSFEVRTGPQALAPYSYVQTPSDQTPQEAPTTTPVAAAISPEATTTVAPVAISTAQAPQVAPTSVSSATHPTGDVPLLVKACVAAISGSFENADVLNSSGYRTRRTSKTRRDYYKKFKVSFGQSAIGIARSASLALHKNSRTKMYHCTVNVTSESDPSVVSNSVMRTLGSLGYQQSAHNTWSQGSETFSVSFGLSGNRNARSASTFFKKNQ